MHLKSSTFEGTGVKFNLRRVGWMRAPPVQIESAVRIAKPALRGLEFDFGYNTENTFATTSDLPMVAWPLADPGSELDGSSASAGRRRLEG